MSRIRGSVFFLVVFSFGEYLLSVCIVLVYCSDFGICFLVPMMYSVVTARS